MCDFQYESEVIFWQPVYNINNNKYIVIEPNDILYIEKEKECSS